MGEWSCLRAPVHSSLTTDPRNSKNIKIQMGRCPVRSIFEDALPVLAKNQHKFE